MMIDSTEIFIRKLFEAIKRIKNGEYVTEEEFFKSSPE